MENLMDFQEVENKLTSFLLNDEKVLWQGQPQSYFYISGIDLYISFIGIAMLLFSIYGIIDAFHYYPRGGRHISMAFFNLPFFLIGFYLGIYRYILRYKRLKYSHYFITNKRLIIAEKFFGHYVFQGMHIKGIEKIEKREKRNGLANISFKGGNLSPKEMRESLSTLERSIIDFFNIKDMQDVLNLVNSIRES